MKLTKRTEEIKKVETKKRVGKYERMLEYELDMNEFWNEVKMAATENKIIIYNKI